MRKFLFIVLLVLTACERRPLLHLPDISEKALVDVYVSVEADIDLLWNEGWRNELVYDWDELKYGKIGYSELKDSLTIVFLKDGKEALRTQIRAKQRTPVTIDAHTVYDVVIFNVNDSVLEMDYSLMTRKVDDFDNGNVGSMYDTHYGPGELFWARIEDLYVSGNYQDYRVETIDGRFVYVLDINSVIEPFSYIYIVQFIIINDDGTEIEAKGISDFTISGVSTRKSIINGEPIDNGLCQVVTQDIKEGQVKGDSLIFASRMTLLDIHQKNTSSWDEDENRLYYTILTIPTKNYGTVTGVVPITNQLKANPKGGIITVAIKNSDIKEAGRTSGGFGVSITEWEEYINDIPF